MDENYCDNFSEADNLSLFQFLWRFARSHQWLADFSVTNYFADRIWESAPLTWLEVLSSLKSEDLYSVLFGFTQPTWPKDLVQFIRESNKVHSLFEHYRPKTINWKAVAEYSCQGSFSKPADDSINNEVQPQAIATAGTTSRLSSKSAPASTAGDIRPVPAVLARGMSEKKRHEVSLLASLIADWCYKHDCVTVVDIGSGLGYLDNVLHSVYGLSVLGVEGENSRCAGAKDRQKRRLGSCPRHTTSQLTLVDSSCSLEHLRRLCVQAVEAAGSPCCCTETASVRQSPSLHTNRVCLVGLHCCGDLSPLLLKQFVQLQTLSSVELDVCGLICVSCCYHRMSYADFKVSGDLNFFPLSDAARLVLSQDTARALWSLSRPCLRLAAQQTREAFRDRSELQRKEHEKHVAFRGIMEVLIKRERLTCTKLAQRSVRKAQFCDFSTYVDAFIERHEIKGLEPMEFRRSAIDLYSKLEPYFKFIEPITVLQACLQPVLEQLLLVDRALFLRQNTRHVHLLRLFDPTLSPRNMVLVASR